MQDTVLTSALTDLVNKGFTHTQIKQAINELKPAPEKSNRRFHHFLTASTGRLAATIATEPDDAAGTRQLVACSVCSSKDAPSKALGRLIAEGRLQIGKFETLPTDLLKEQIQNRSILALFVTDRLAQKLGYANQADFLADIRPRAEFIPEKN